MADMMTFPDTWEEFEEYYGITDREEIYTNGARLISSFRVKQWLDHIADHKTEPRTEEYCGKCNHKGCDNCVADASNPYCVPSRYEPKTEPQTEYRRVGQAIDSVTGKVLGETYDVPQTDCSWK